MIYVMFHLRQYQHNITDETRALFKQGVKTVLIRLATGGGKTLLTANMLNIAAGKGFTSWFIVHRRELVKQTIQSFSNIGVNNFGVVSNGFVEAKKHPIQICSIQSLQRRITYLPAPKFIAWDECHHCSAGTYKKVYEAYKAAFHIGLSATPQRLDGTGLRQYFSHMVHGPEMSQLIEEGFLVPYKLYAPSGINVAGVHTQMGDFKKNELVKVADRPSITGDAIKHYLKYGTGKRAVVFCVSIEHSKHVVNQFNQAGIVAAHVDGETPVEDRDMAIRRFKNGEIKVLSNVELFGEGFDLPALEVAILLRPTQSLGLYLQQVGRALRPSPGKSHAIILDHAGNCERHGLPDEERIWSLDGRPLKSRGATGGNVRVCPKCFAAQAIGLDQCKYCQFAFETTPRKIEEVEGDLVEVDPAVLRRKKAIAQAKCESKEDLIAEGKRRGYRHPERWAHYVWQARQSRKIHGKGLSGAEVE